MRAQRLQGISMSVIRLGSRAGVLLALLLPPSAADTQDLAARAWVAVPGIPRAEHHNYTAVFETGGFFFVGGVGLLGVLSPDGHWNQRVLGDGPVITQINGRSASEVYAVGHFRAVYRWDGRSWSNENLDVEAGPFLTFATVSYIDGRWYAFGRQRGDAGIDVFVRRDDGHWVPSIAPLGLHSLDLPCDNGLLHHRQGDGDVFADCGDVLFLHSRSGAVDWVRIPRPGDRDGGVNLWSGESSVALGSLGQSSELFLLRDGRWVSLRAPRGAGPGFSVTGGRLHVPAGRRIYCLGLANVGG